MSAVDLLQRPPAPNHAHAPARARNGDGLHWFRLVVIFLILIRIVAALPVLAWLRLAALWKQAARQLNH